jgi:hypothetical protein
MQEKDMETQKVVEAPKSASPLRGCHERLVRLAEELDGVAAGQRSARALLQRLQESPDASVQGIGLSLQFQAGPQIPIPLPTDREHLLGLVEDSLTFLSQEITRLWSELHATTATACAICEEATARYQAELAASREQLPAGP